MQPQLQGRPQHVGDARAVGWSPRTARAVEGTGTEPMRQTVCVSHGRDGVIGTLKIVNPGCYILNYRTLLPSTPLSHPKTNLGEKTSPRLTQMQLEAL